MIIPIVRQTLTERALVRAGDHVLVACSGGADSMSLLHVLHHVRTEFGITLCAASIDHGVRSESADEVAGVAEFAGSLGVPFQSARLDGLKGTPSLQAQARTARYEALHALAGESGATRIAVGHTQDDQAETVLGRLLRGAGVRGMAAITPRRDDGVVRPLIDCDRPAVRAYAETHGITFVDDPSNEDKRFDRIRIRREVLPTLLRIDPQAVRHLAELADQAAEFNTLVDAQLAALPSDDCQRVPVDVFTSSPPPVRARWFQRWIAAKTGITPGRSHIVAIGRLLQGEGEVLLGSDWSVRREAGELLLEYRENRRTRSNRLS